MRDKNYIDKRSSAIVDVLVKYLRKSKTTVVPFTDTISVSRKEEVSLTTTMTAFMKKGTRIDFRIEVSGPHSDKVIKNIRDAIHF